MMKMFRSRPANRGFTLIELMIVVAILGIVAAVAINAYTKNIRRARRTEITADLSKISILQETAMSVFGHYISSSNSDAFNTWYPPASAFGTNAAPVEIVSWDITDPLYTRDGTADGPNFRGGGAQHGFDALGFMPQGAASRCSYATVSGLGTFVDPATGNTLTDSIPANNLETTVFTADTRYRVRPWFYSAVACDLDHDGEYWLLYTNSYNSRVFDGITINSLNAVENAY